MATTKTSSAKGVAAEQSSEWSAERLDELEARVARMENLIGNRLAAKQDQVTADKALVSRFANTREEAIAQQAARERLADLGLIDEKGALRAPPVEEDAEDETPPVSEAPQGAGT